MNRHHDYVWTNFELNSDNTVEAVIGLKKLIQLEKVNISFRDIKNADIGLCLLYVSLLEFYKGKIKFHLSTFPKRRGVRNKLNATGIFKLVKKNQSRYNDNQRIKMLKFDLNTEDIGNILVQIKTELIIAASKAYSRSEQERSVMQKDLEKVFGELLNNINEHAKVKNSIIFVVGEITSCFIKFAILDQGIGYRQSIESRGGTAGDVFKEGLERNYLSMIFENRKNIQGYSGKTLKRGNGSKRLKETIEKYGNRAKLQILSKGEYYEIALGNSSDRRIKETHESIGTLISFELPIKEKKGDCTC